MEECQPFTRFPRKMVLYSSTKIGVLKPWTIICNLIRFDLGFLQASKPFYRKLNNKEELLEEFQRLANFSRKKLLYSSTKFSILKPWTIISNLIRFHLGFSQASKQVYRKLKYREKVLEEFQRLPRFPRKIVLYSSTKFGILKPWTIISNLIRFDLAFWQASKPFYGKLKFKEKVLEECEPVTRSPRKMELYSSTKFGVLKPWTIICNLIRFDLGFLQTSKQIYRILKYREKVLEEFQRLLRFPRKMVDYSSTKFGILRPWTIISNFIRFDLGFWQASEPFYRKLKYGQEILEEFQRWPRFPRKMVFYSSTNLCILKL